jgi:ribonuclease Z
MTELRITFLGTSAAIPTFRRGLSSVALTRGSELLLFDAGEGMQQNFIKAHLGMNRKMKIFVTHMHADHCVGLLGLLQTMSLQGRQRSVDIFGQPRLAEFIKENMRIIHFGLVFDVNVHIIEGEGIITKARDYQITCCESSHSVPAYSFCVTEFDRPGKFDIEEAKRIGIPEGELYRALQEGRNILIDGKTVNSSQVVGPPRPGRKIGISGDTRPTEKLRLFFKDCDLLIYESTYSQDEQTKAMESFHSTATEAAFLAKSCSVKKLYLTHFSARYEDVTDLVKEAQRIHSNTEAAEDLKVVEVPYDQNYLR